MLIATSFNRFKLQFARSGITAAFCVKRLLSSVCMNSCLSLQLFSFGFQERKKTEYKKKGKVHPRTDHEGSERE